LRHAAAGYHPKRNETIYIPPAGGSDTDRCNLLAERESIASKALKGFCRFLLIPIGHLSIVFEYYSDSALPKAHEEPLIWAVSSFL
jgi:hypothetical protein